MSWDQEPPSKDELAVADIGRWDAEPPSASERSSTVGDAALQGLGNGLTMGYAPHLQALAEKPLARLYDAINGTNVAEDTADDYVKRRDAWIKRQTKLAEDNPVAYGGANVAGNLISGLAIPGGTAAKAASTAKKIATATAMGGVMGAAANPGDKEGELDPLQLGSRAKNAAIGAGTGLALAGAAQATAKYAPKAIDAARNALSEAAEDRAASALGMTKALRKKLGDARVREVGRSALDNEVVTPLSGTKKMLERANDLADSSGDTISKTMDALDDQGIKAFNPLDVGTRVDAEIGNVYRNEPLFQGLSNQYENTLDTILNRGDQPISFADAQRLKEVLQQYGYKEGMAAPGREIAQKVSGVVKDELENAVEEGAKKLSNAEMAERYLAAKKNYGSSQDMMRALENRLAGEQGNQGGIIGGLLGLRDAGAKAVGAVTGGPVGYVSGEMAASGVRAFGNQASAVAMDRVSKLMLRSPRFQQLAQTNPKAFSAAVVNMARRLEENGTFPKAASSELDTDSSTPSNSRIPPEEARDKFIRGN